MANIIFALFDYSILKNSYHYQQIKWIFSYKLRPEPPSAHQHKFNSARSTTKSVTNCDTKNSSQKKRRKIILACLVFWFWYCCVAPKARYLLHLLCTKVNICMKSMLVPTAQSWHKNLIEDFFTICENLIITLKTLQTTTSFIHDLLNLPGFHHHHWHHLYQPHHRLHQHHHCEIRIFTAFLFSVICKRIITSSLRIYR